MSSELPLFQSSYLDFTRGQHLAFAGRSACGKSEAIKNVYLTHKHQFNGVFVMSSTEEIQPFYSEFIRRECIENSKDIDRLERIYMERKELVRRLKVAVNQGELSIEEAKQRGNFMIILEDVLFWGRDFYRLNVIQELCHNARHAWITVCHSLQRVKDLSPLYQTQMDWIFAWHVDQPSRRRDIFNINSVCQQFLNFDEFDTAFTSVTGNRHHCLVIKTGNSRISSSIIYISLAT